LSGGKGGGECCPNSAWKKKKRERPGGGGAGVNFIIPSKRKRKGFDIARRQRRGDEKKKGEEYSSVGGFPERKKGEKLKRPSLPDALRKGGYRKAVLRNHPEGKKGGEGGKENRFSNPGRAKTRRGEKGAKNASKREGGKRLHIATRLPGERKKSLFSISTSHGWPRKRRGLEKKKKKRGRVRCPKFLSWGKKKKKKKKRNTEKKVKLLGGGGGKERIRKCRSRREKKKGRRHGPVLAPGGGGGQKKRKKRELDQPTKKASPS